MSTDLAALGKFQKKTNAVPVFTKDKQDDLGSSRPVSLTSIPDKIMERLI